MSVALPSPAAPPARGVLVRRSLLAVATVVVAVSFVAGVTAISPWALAAAVAGGAPGWLLLAAALNALSHTVGGVVWHHSLRSAGLGRLPFAATLRAHWICRGVSELLPFQVGEAARVLALRKEPGAEGATWRIVGSIGGFKILDTAVNLTLAFAIVLILLEPSLPFALAMLGVVGLAVIIAVCAPIGSSIVRHLPGSIRPGARELIAGCAILRARRVAVPLGVQSLSTILRIAGLGALLMAYGAPPAAAPALFAVVVLAGSIPLAPGGIGVREAAAVPVLTGVYGLGLETALAASLAVQAVTLAVALTGASLALVGRARVELPLERAPRPRTA